MIYKPLVSIGLAVYNGEAFVGRAINSVLNQTYQKWELIIVNDGSTDNTLTVLSAFKDERIKIINLDNNIGVTEARNKYLHDISGKYLAIIDADDQWLSTKLEKQIAFLERNTKYGLCGTYAWKTDGSYKKIWSYPIEHDDINIRLIWGSAIIHSSLMVRVNLLKSNSITYDDRFNQAEDYHLITKCVQLSKAYNLPEPLLFYFEHLEQFTSRKKDEQMRYSSIASMEFLKKTLNIDFIGTDFEELFFKIFSYNFFSIKLSELNLANSLLSQISNKNEIKKIFNQPHLKKSLAERWFWTCYHSNTGLNGCLIYYKASLSKCFPLTRKSKAKFIIKKIFHSIKQTKNKCFKYYGI